MKNEKPVEPAVPAPSMSTTPEQVTRCICSRYLRPHAMQPDCVSAQCPSCGAEKKWNTRCNHFGGTNHTTCKPCADPWHGVEPAAAPEAPIIIGESENNPELVKLAKLQFATKGTFRCWQQAYGPLHSAFELGRASLSGSARPMDNYVGWARYRHQGDRQWISLCDSDDEGAFKIYRRLAEGDAGTQPSVNGALWLCYHALKASEWKTKYNQPHCCPYCNRSDVGGGHDEDCMIGNGLKAMSEAVSGDKEKL